MTRTQRSGPATEVSSQRCRSASTVLPRALSVFSLLAASWLAGRDASACGVSAPVGPTGVVTMCWGEHDHDHDGMAPLRWHAGVNFGSFRSELRFNNDNMTARVEEQAVTSSLEYRPGGRVTFQVSAGAVTSGWIMARGLMSPIQPGWIYGAAVSVRILDGTGNLPFVLGSASLAVSSLGISEPQVAGSNVRMISTDGRLGLTIGKTFLETVTPYVVGRVFAGPIFWQLRGQQIVGQDANHYQVGAGLVITLAKRVDLYGEVAFLGEQRVSAGAGFAF